MPTGTGTSILNHLQLRLPTHRRAILTKHNCEETGPLGGPMRRRPTTPERHHRHNQPRPRLSNHSVRHPLRKEGPSPRWGPSRPFPTAPRMAPVSALPPVPHGTRHGDQLTGQERQTGSITGLPKTTATPNPGGQGLHTVRLQTGTNPPSDGPFPTASPTIGLN